VEEVAAGDCAQPDSASPMAMDSGCPLVPLGELKICRIEARRRRPPHPRPSAEAAASSHRPPSPPRPARDKRRRKAPSRKRSRRLLKKLAEITTTAIFHLGSSSMRSRGTRLASRPNARTVKLHSQTLLAEISDALATAHDTSCHQRSAKVGRNIGTHPSRPAGPGALLPHSPTTGENNLPLLPKSNPAHLLRPRRPATPPRAARDLPGTAFPTLNGRRVGGERKEISLISCYI